MNKKKLIVCIIFVLMLGAISVYAGYRISIKAHNEELLESVQEAAHSEDTSEKEITSASISDESTALAITDDTEAQAYESPIDFESLQASNEDIYAWITIPDTTIDYPIAQHPTDDSYYLSHGADGIYSDYGCPYTELTDSKKFTDFNTIIYGHNMNDGSMFGALHQYEDEDFFKEHRTIYIYTTDHTFTYTVFAAVMYTDAHIPYYYDDNVIADREAFLNSLQTDIVKERSIYYEDMDVTSSSKIVTLSTCDRKLRSNRFLVVAVMTEVDGVEVD